MATSTATFFRQLGSTMGVAVLGTMFAASMSRRLAELAAAEVDHVVAMKEALTASVRLVFQLGVVIAIVGFAVTLPLPQLPLRRSNAPAPRPAE